MSANVATFPGSTRDKKHDEPINIATDPPHNNSKVAHNDEPMTKAEREEMAELREWLHQLAGSAVINARSAPAVQVQTQPMGNGGMGAWGRTFVTIAVVLIGWIFTAMYIAKSTETEIRVSNAILTEQLRETRENFNEYRKATEIKLALSDERYRQISIAMESRGLKMPTQ